MNKILLIISALFVSQTYAAAPTFCSDSDLNMTGSNSCLSTCSAVAAKAGAQLSSGSSGFCIGQSSYNKITLYELALGRESSDGPLCTIWSGDLDIITSNYAVGTSKDGGIIDISSCPSGVYDVLFLTTKRFEEYAGSTVFPDGSGKKVRTTSAFANDSSDYSVVADWRETSTSHSDDSLGYVRPTSGWNTVYKKLASTPSATDLTSSSDVKMTFDWGKQMISANDSSIRSGWYCDGVDSFCEKVVATDTNKSLLRIRHTETTVVEGLPLTISEGDATLSSFDLAYHSTSANRGGTDELGLKVLWHNDGGTLKYLGVYPGESGLYLAIGQPTQGSIR